MKRSTPRTIVVLTAAILLAFAGPSGAAPPEGLPPADTSVAVVRADTVCASLGEGAIWHPGRQTLFWVDITGRWLHEYDPQRGSGVCWELPRMVSTVVPESDTTVVIASQDRIERLSLRTARRDSVAAIPDGGGAIRTNDGKCDPAGRFWVGTMAFSGAAGAGSLYRVERDGSVEVALDGVTISNGIVWTADRRTMYYIDTPTRRIDRYAYEEYTGAIRFEKTVVTVPEGWGWPDGMTIDDEGLLWVGHWGGYGVYCWDPRSGRLVRRIAVPAANVTSCAFGGPGLATLYITTAEGRNSEGVHAPGGLYRCTPGGQGVEYSFFGGEK